MITINIKLSGLTCSACQKIVEKRIKKIDGVSTVLVSLKSGETEITANKAVPVQEVKNALSDTHYQIIEE